MLNKLLLLIITSLLLSACVTVSDSALERKKSPEKAVENYTKLGLGYLQNKRYGRAKQRLDRALEIDPDSAQANEAMGLYYLTQGEAELAEEYYLTAIDLDSDYIPAKHRYGQLLMQQNKLEEACDYLAEVVEDVDYQQRAKAQQELGKCYYQKGDIEEAVATYKKSLRGRKYNASILLNLATVLFEQKKFSDAWQYYLRFDQLVAKKQSQHNSYSLWLGFKLANIAGDAKRSAQFVSQLTSQFPDSVEYKLYKKSF